MRSRSTTTPLVHTPNQHPYHHTLRVDSVALNHTDALNLQHSERAQLEARRGCRRVQAGRADTPDSRSQRPAGQAAPLSGAERTAQPFHLMTRLLQAVTPSGNPDVEQAGILRSRSRIFTESLGTDAQQAEFGIENHQFQNSIAAAPQLSFEQNSRWALHVYQNLGLRDHLNSDAGFTREFERHVQLSQNFTWSSHLNFRVRIFRRAFN